MLDCVQNTKNFTVLKKLKIYFDRKDFMHRRHYIIQYQVINNTDDKSPGKKP